MCNKILSLPLYYDLTPYQQNFVVNNIKSLDTINTVIVGLGNMGMKHYNNILKNNNYKVLGYVDVKAKDNVNIPRLNINQNNNIDLAIITVNTENHYKISRELINKRINLLIEKPGFSNLDEFNKISKLLEGKEHKIGISMLERYNSFLEFRNFKEYDRIEIYRVTGYSNNFNSNLILHDLLIHDLDILVYFNNLELDKINIINIIRKKDIYIINLKCCKVYIYIMIGNSKNISKRKHIYYKNEKIKEYNFMNKENKIKSIYNDYINFIQGNVNKICTLEQNFKLISLIEKLSKFNSLTFDSKL